MHARGSGRKSFITMTYFYLFAAHLHHRQCRRLAVSGNWTFDSPATNPAAAGPRGFDIHHTLTLVSAVELQTQNDRLYLNNRNVIILFV